MSSIVPRLDDTDFDRLVEEARGHIPRYAPEWTDHNLHDPGMTLIDLLAWIVDQQVYRVGFVGDSYLRAFAALLGHRPAAATAAKGLVWVGDPVREGRHLVAATTKVTCLRRQDLDFVLERTLFLSGAELTNTFVENGDDEFELDLIERTQGSTALPGRPGDRGALIIQADRPLAPVEGADVSIGFEVASPPGPPPELGHEWGPLVIDYRVGDETWTRVEVVDDGTLGLGRTGAVTVSLPDRRGLDDSGRVAGHRPSELRILLDQGFFPVAPQLRHISLDTLPVIQVTVIPAALVGRGTGLPDQQIDLATDGIVPHPGAPDQPLLQLDVNGEAWKEQPDFEDSGPEDNHYVRRFDRIEFGNGVNGRRPALGVPIFHHGFALTQGRAGNLQAGLTWSVPALGRGSEPFGHNLGRIDGGSAGDTAESLIARARASVTNRTAVLSDDDLAGAARELPGFAVARAEVLSRFDARVPDDDVDGVRTLVVIPDRDPSRGPQPVDRSYLDAVAAALDPRRVLGERLIVQGPRIERMVVELSVGLEPGASKAVVEREIRLALGGRLSDIPQSDDIEPWPLGRPVTAQEMKMIAARVPGVATVPISRVGRLGGSTGFEPIPIARDAAAIGTVSVEWATATAGGQLR